MSIKKTSNEMSGIGKVLSAAKRGVIFLLIFSNSLCLAVEQATISVVFSSNIEPYRQSLEGFKEFFDENGVTLRIYKHNLDSKLDLEKEKADAVYLRIKKENPDMILALGTKALKLAKEKIKDTPAVFSMVLKPETITDLNISGVSLDITPETKLKNLRKIFPDTKNIGLIYSPQSDLLYKETLQACKDSGLQLVSKRILSKKEFSDALEDISWQIDWFLMTPDTDIYFPKLVEHLLRTSLKDKFPVVGLSSTYVRAGALISFDCDYEDLGRQTAELASGILAGRKQVDAQFIRPRKVKLSLNLLTAEILDVKIPQETIKQAGEVFGK